MEIVYSNRAVKVIGLIGLMLTAILLISSVTVKIAFATSAGEWFAKGANYHNNKEYDNAVAAYTQAILIDPNYINAYNNRGLIYSSKGMYDRAIADFNKALEIDPKHISSYNNRALAYDNKGMYDSALQDLNKALSLNPDFLATYDNRATVYIHKGMFDQAIADCNKAIKLDPKVANVYVVLGDAYRCKGLYNQALAEYNKALTLDPKSAEAYAGRGNVYAQAGMNEQATMDYNKAKSLDPNALSQINLDQKKNTIGAAKKNSDLTNDDFVIAGISLAMNQQSIIEILGTGYTTGHFTMGYFSGGRNVKFTKYIYPGITVIVGDAKGFVADIEVTDAKYGTARGITIGEPISKVKELYGEEDIHSPSKLGYQQFEYRMKRGGPQALDFSVDLATNKITRISINIWGD